MREAQSRQFHSLHGGYFELRISRCNPSKIEELFECITRDLPELHRKHQIASIATWRSISAAPQPFLASLLHWNSLDDRLDRIRPFLADPGWPGSGAKDGDSLISETEVSILKGAKEWPVLFRSADGKMTSDFHELRLYRLGVGGTDVGFAYVSRVEMRFMMDHGATVNALFRVWLGDLPQAVALLSWPDYATRAAAFEMSCNDRELKRIQASQRAQFGATAVGRTHCHLLQPLALS